MAGRSRATPSLLEPFRPVFLYNGALSTYETLGFSRDRQIGKHRWVVTKVVDAEAVGDVRPAAVEHPAEEEAHCDSSA